MQKFKLFTFLLLSSILLITYSGCGSSNENHSSIPPCADGTTIVEPQSEAPAQLTINEASCDASFSTVKLMIRNVSDKPISAYKISWIKDYEYKNAVESLEGVNSSDEVLELGASKEILLSEGFTNGTSYGTPVGKLKRDTIKILSIDFVDGTKWTENKAKQ